MTEIHYLISDASKKVDVESHVLRYWEDELGLEIPRNDMGHRYYTELHIKLFQKIRELKEKGYQLKAIKHVLSKMMGDGNKIILPDGGLEADMVNTIKEGTQMIRILENAGDELSKAEDKEPKEQKDKPEATATQLRAIEGSSSQLQSMDDKMEQFQNIMNQIIGQAIEANNEQLSQDISRLVNEKMVKELEYMMRINDEREEERFRNLDEILRSYQKDGKGRAEAAAAKMPFFKRRKIVNKNRK